MTWITDHFISEMFWEFIYKRGRWTSC